MNEAILQRLQRMVLEALEERRGLIAYSRIEALEMDRMARECERKALDGIRAEIERHQAGGVALNLRNRLGRMDEQLADLERQIQIAETSRRLQRDEITWRAFEDVASILGVEG